MRALTVVLAAIFSLLVGGAPLTGQIKLVNVTTCGPQSFPGNGCAIPATAQGNLLVVGWQIGGGASTSISVKSITDNAGNTYAEAGAARSTDAATGSSADIWYAANLSASANSVAIVPSAAVPNAGVVIWEFSGVSATAPFDQSAVLNSQPSSSAATGAAVSNVSAGELVVSIMPNSGTLGAIASGNPFVSDSNMTGDGWAHLIASAAGPYSPKWVVNPAGTYSSSTASFRAAAIASNACDLDSDGAVTFSDIQLATNMALGAAPCSANVDGPSVCNVVVVQRVINAALGGSCVTDSGVITTPQHYVSLSWTPSVTPGVIGYNVYRSASANGSYNLLNSSVVPSSSYTDNSVSAGQTYYYATTAVTANNNESALSNQAKAVIPIP